LYGHDTNLEVDAAKVLAEAMVCTTCRRQAICVCVLWWHNFFIGECMICEILVVASIAEESMGPSSSWEFQTTGSLAPGSKFFWNNTLPNHPNLRLLSLKVIIRICQVKLCRIWDIANIFEHFGKTEEEDAPNLPASKKQKVEAR